MLLITAIKENCVVCIADGRLTTSTSSSIGAERNFDKDKSATKRSRKQKTQVGIFQIRRNTSTSGACSPLIYAAGDLDWGGFNI